MPCKLKKQEKELTAYASIDITLPLKLTTEKPFSPHTINQKYKSNINLTRNTNFINPSLPNKLLKTLVILI